MADLPDLTLSRRDLADRIATFVAGRDHGIRVALRRKVVAVKMQLGGDGAQFEVSPRVMTRIEVEPDSPADQIYNQQEYNVDNVDITYFENSGVMLLPAVEDGATMYAASFAELTYDDEDMDDVNDEAAADEGEPIRRRRKDYVASSSFFIALYMAVNGLRTIGKQVLRNAWLNQLIDAGIDIEQQVSWSNMADVFTSLPDFGKKFCVFTNGNVLVRRFGDVAGDVVVMVYHSLSKRWRYIYDPDSYWNLNTPICLTCFLRHEPLSETQMCPVYKEAYLTERESIPGVLPTVPRFRSRATVYADIEAYISELDDKRGEHIMSHLGAAFIRHES